MTADWRIANICALHKKNARELPENYRPISLTSISSKILEHIVYRQTDRQDRQRESTPASADFCPTISSFPLDNMAFALATHVRSNLYMLLMTGPDQ